VVTEHGRFSIELKVPQRPVADDGLGLQVADLEPAWCHCREVAEGAGLRMVATGILPTVTDADLTIASSSVGARWRARNGQVRRQRHGRPIRVDITAPGGEVLQDEHRDAMPDAAATSFQVHLQVSAEGVVRADIATLIASGPVIAMTGTSPLPFGCRLLQELRIPLFEQSLNLDTRADGTHALLRRVSFGSGCASHSMAGCFRKDIDRLESLLSIEIAETAEHLAHLRLHDGTNWRWNRPLVGFDAGGCGADVGRHDGQPRVHGRSRDSGCCRVRGFGGAVALQRGATQLLRGGSA
jgi:hypothetical protein